MSALIAFGGVLERLEAKGWIERDASPQDRRVKRLQPTHAGRRLLRQVEPAVHRVQERLLAPLAPGERATMVRLLGELAELNPAPLEPPPSAYGHMKER